MEDEPHTSELLREIVFSNGYTSVTAKDGCEALDAFQKQNFQLVLLDLRLPDMSGIEVLKKIRKMAPCIPVVIVTGSPQDILTIQDQEFLPDKVIPKPFKLRQIKEALAIIKSKG